MRFSPKSENEIAAEGLLHPGIYGFEITEAEEAVSKAGNEMIKLTVHVFDESGVPTTLFDYLMEKVAYKLRHAAEVCGLLGDYELGELRASEFAGKTGRCKVVIQKDKNGQYPDKNAIADYVDGGGRHAPYASRAAAKVAVDDIDDSIPF